MVFKQIREQIKQRRSDKRQATQKKPKTTAPRPRPWNKKSVERKASTNKSILAPLPPKKVMEPLNEQAPPMSPQPIKEQFVPVFPNELTFVQVPSADEVSCDDYCQRYAAICGSR